MVSGFFNKLHKMGFNCLDSYFIKYREYWRTKRKEIIFSFIDGLLDDDFLQGYENISSTKLSTIGKRVWVFWYQGFENAPITVKKCVSIMKQLDGIDLVLLDKTNLEEYFFFESNIRDLFLKRYISMQTFSDIVRFQLLNRYGGFWFDATLLVLRKDFIIKFQNERFFSIRHLHSDFFTQGRWSIYCIGGGCGNPIASFIYKVYVNYFETYNKPLDYFQSDYILLYAYENFEWCRLLVDSLPVTVTGAEKLQEIIFKEYDEKKFNKIKETNWFQKLNWRGANKIAKNNYLENLD